MTKTNITLMFPDWDHFDDMRELMYLTPQQESSLLVKSAYCARIHHTKGVGEFHLCAAVHPYSVGVVLPILALAAEYDALQERCFSYRPNSKRFNILWDELNEVSLQLFDLVASAEESA